MIDRERVLGTLETCPEWSRLWAAVAPLGTSSPYYEQAIDRVVMFAGRAKGCDDVPELRVLVGIANYAHDVRLALLVRSRNARRDAAERERARVSLVVADALATWARTRAAALMMVMRAPTEANA